MAVMSSCKLLFVFFVSLMILVFVEGQAKDLCQRPKNSFENLNHLYDYVECLKSQSTTRYGKRAYSPLLAKIRPNLLTDYDSVLQLYDLLYHHRNEE